MENKYITVSALNRYISYKFDTDANLQEVYLKGEISNFKYSGKHCYFSLKDTMSEISAMFFYPNNVSLTFVPKDGMTVNVVGRVQTYQKKGTYSIVVKEMHAEGIGLLYQQFLDLKEKLYKEGLFDESKKLPLPQYPEVVGVITASTGDAIHDIISTFNRRLPLTKIKLFPAQVQGTDAPRDLIRALKEAYADKTLSALIIGRGGGSFEDLSCFNDESLARLLFESPIPTVSAIGHEADYTICDFVSSYRAPTPTGAAIALSKEKNDVKDLTSSLTIRLKNAVKNKLTNCYNDLQKEINTYGLKHFDEILNNFSKNLDGYTKHLELLSPQNLVSKIEYDINNSITRINNSFNLYINNLSNELNITGKLDSAIEKYVISNENNLNNMLDKIVLLNPFNIMNKGYSIVYSNNNIISSVDDVEVNEEIDIKLKDGTIGAVITKKSE